MQEEFTRFYLAEEKSKLYFSTLCKICNKILIEAWKSLNLTVVHHSTGVPILDDT